MIFKKKGIKAPQVAKPKGISVEEVQQGRDAFDRLVNDAVDQRHDAVKANEELVTTLFQRNKELTSESDEIQMLAGFA